MVETKKNRLLNSYVVAIASIIVLGIGVLTVGGSALIERQQITENFEKINSSNLSENIEELMVTEEEVIEEEFAQSFEIEAPELQRVLTEG